MREKGNACSLVHGKFRRLTMNVRPLSSVLGGDWSKVVLVGVWGPLMTAAVVLLFAASARHFPGGYDWRYEVMCRLGYPSANPEGSVLWSAALALTCIMGLPCAGYFSKRLAPCAPKIVSFARTALSSGLLAGLLVAADGMLLPKLNDLAYKLHEIIATFAFAAIFFGVLAFWYAAMRWLRASRRWTLGACGFISALVAAPLAGAMLSQAYLFYVPNDLGWVDREWADKGVPVYLSFAFWEWLAIAAVYVGLYVIALLLPATAGENAPS